MKIAVRRMAVRRMLIKNHAFAAAGVLAFLTPGSIAYCQARPNPGQLTFERNCGTCHGGDGLGGEMGPNLAYRLPRLSDEQLSEVLVNGKPNKGMPGFPNLRGDEKTSLMTFLRTIHPLSRPAPVSRTLELADGTKLTGLVLNETLADLQCERRTVVFTCCDPAEAAIERRPHRLTGPRTTAIPVVIATVPLRKSASTTSRAWRRSGFSRWKTCPAPKQLPLWFKDSCT